MSVVSSNMLAANCDECVAYCNFAAARRHGVMMMIVICFLDLNMFPDLKFNNPPSYTGLELTQKLAPSQLWPYMSSHVASNAVQYIQTKGAAEGQTFTGQHTHQVYSLTSIQMHIHNVQLYLYIIRHSRSHTDTAHTGGPAFMQTHTFLQQMTECMRSLLQKQRRKALPQSARPAKRQRPHDNLSILVAKQHTNSNRLYLFGYVNVHCNNTISSHLEFRVSKHVNNIHSSAHHQAGQGATSR
jgi:hypothetical protein